MKTSLFFLALACLLLTSTAHAGSTHCSNPDGTVLHSSSTSDGGAPRGPSYRWTIGEETFGIELGYELPEMDQVNYEFDWDNVVNLNESTVGTVVTAVYAIRAVVTSLSGEELFSGLMICESTGSTAGYMAP